MHRCRGLTARHPNPTSCRKPLFLQCLPLNSPFLFCHGMRTQALCYGANLKKSRLRLLRRVTISSITMREVDVATTTICMSPTGRTSLLLQRKLSQAVAAICCSSNNILNSNNCSSLSCCLDVAPSFDRRKLFARS